MSEGHDAVARDQNEICREVLLNLYDGVYMVDSDKKVTFWNKGAERITGFTASEVLGQVCSDNLLGHAMTGNLSVCSGICPVEATLQDGQPREQEMYLHGKDGEPVPVLVRVTPMPDSHGEVKGAVQVFSDMSFMEAAIRRIQNLEQIALVDSLTGIGNRRYLEMTLIARLSEARRYGWSLGVLFIDIDHFKDVNDRYGHNVGDKVLEMVAEELSSSLRPFDVVARWGGEEFIALLVNVEQGELSAIAERARKEVAAAGHNHGDDVIKVTVSVGATLSRPDDTLDTIVRRADRLMYESKSRGRNCVTSDAN